MISPVEATLLIPAVAALALALIPSWRYATFVNVCACAASLAAVAWLLHDGVARSDLIAVDGFNALFLGLAAGVALTTSLYSIDYIRHEAEAARLSPVAIRLYHVMFQSMLGALYVALLANNTGLMWVGLEVATLCAVVAVGLPGTHRALQAAWKYLVLGGVAIALAFFATILCYVAAQDVMGPGLPAMALDALTKNAAALDPRLLSLAFAFAVAGYGATAGLVPFQSWLPDAHAQGPTPIAAILSGLLTIVAFYALLRFKAVLGMNTQAIDAGVILMTLGFFGLFIAALALHRQRDINRLFAYASIAHMGVAAIAFGIGGPLANFAGLLHMVLHVIVKSAVFFAAGRVVQIEGEGRLAGVTGLSRSHPWLALGLGCSTLAIAGLPPFGLFASEFLLMQASVARSPWIAAGIAAGLMLVISALILHVQQLILGEPKSRDVAAAPHAIAWGTWVSLVAHLLALLLAGLWLPEPIARVLRDVAAQLG